MTPSPHCIVFDLKHRLVLFFYPLYFFVYSSKGGFLELPRFNQCLFTYLSNHLPVNYYADF